MRTLEQAICECTRKAEANQELAKYNKSHVDRANDLKNAEECKQLAEWLRELAERRKQQKIVWCKDCKWWRKQKDSAQGRCRLLGTYPTGAWYCANAERRTE